MLNFVPDNAAADSQAFGSQAWGVSWESEGLADHGLLLRMIAASRGEAAERPAQLPKRKPPYFQPERMSGFCATS